MLKRKRVIALLASFAIVGNTTSSAVYNFKVFAEEQTNKENTQQLNTSSVESLNNTTEQGSNQILETNKNTSLTPSEAQGVIISSVSDNAIKSGDTYYTNDDSIQFNISYPKDKLTFNNEVFGEGFEIKPTHDEDSSSISVVCKKLLPNKQYNTVLYFENELGETNTYTIKFGRFANNTTDLEIEYNADIVKNDNTYYTNSNSLELKVKIPHNFEIIDASNGTIVADENGPIIDEYGFAKIKYTDIKPNIDNKSTLTFKNILQDAIEIKFDINYHNRNNQYPILDTTSLNPSKLKGDIDGATVAYRGEEPNRVLYLNKLATGFNLDFKAPFTKEVKISSIKDSSGNSLSNDIFTTSVNPDGQCSISSVKDIPSNETISLEFYLIDVLGNKSTNELKFHRDSILPNGELNTIQDSLVKDIIDSKEVFYIKDSLSEVSLDLNLINTSDLDDVVINEIADDNFKAKYDKDSNKIILSDIKHNFEPTDLSINLIDVNGNMSDKITYTFARDIIKPTIELNNNAQISFADGNNLYLKHDTKDFELKFTAKDNKKLKSYILEVDGIKSNPKKLDGLEKAISETIHFESLDKEIEEKTIKLIVEDFYGNEQSMSYTLIKDPNKYEISHTNIDKITYGDKAFKQSTGLNFDTYISNTNNFDQKFYFKHDTEKFLIYYKDSSDKEILVDTEYPIALHDGTNTHTFVIKSKNGSFDDVEAIFNIHVDVKPLVVKFMYGPDNNYLSRDSVYSNADGIFNFKLSVDDSDVSEIKDIKASIQYKDFNGEDPNNISGTFELGNHFIKENKDGTISYSLGLDSSKLPDGKYEVAVDIYSNFEDRIIETNPIKKFFKSIFKNNGGNLETQTMTFYVDSKAPTAKLVSIDNRSESDHYIDLNKNAFINTNDIKIAIPKSDIDNKIDLNQIKTLTLLYGEDKKVVNIDHNNVDSTTINGIDYYLYDYPNNDSVDLINEQSHDLDIEIYDNAINISDDKSTGNKSIQSFNYTVDRTSPEIYNVEIVNNKDKSPYGKDFTLTDINKELYMDVDSLSSGSKDKNLRNYSVTIEDPDSKVTTYNELTSESFELPIKDFSKEGFYKITIDSTDEAKNTDSRTFGFNIDNSNPNVNIGQFNSDPLFTNLNNLKVDTLKANSTTTSDNMNVKEDNLKSITLDIVENGSSKSAISSTTSNDFNKVNFDVNSLSDGKYNVKLNVVDKAGHYGEANGTLVIDGGKPKVNIVEPILGVNTSDENPVGPIHKSEKSVNPTITINDVTTTHDDVTVTLNGNTIGTKVIDSGKYNLKLSLNQAISAENIHNLSVKVKDRPINENKANYTAFNNNINFALDRTAPDISVTAGGKNVSQGSKIYLNAKDSKGLVATVTDKISELDEIDVKTIITPANGSQSTTGNSYTFNNDDTYSIKVIAIDKAKNESTFDFTAVVDTDIPKISIEGVKDGQHTNKDVLPSISISDETAKVTITLNGKPYTKGETLKKENNYTLVVKAEDDAGNIDEIIINFVIDKTKPVITITGIKHNHKYTSENTKGDIKPLITWDDPEALLTILLNNLDYSGEAIYKDGAYVLFVKAVDKAGNVAEEQYRFNVNISKPEVKVLTIEDKKIYDGPVLLDITFKDAVKYKIFVNGKEYQLGDTISEPGEYELLIVAEDEDGNKTEEKRTFTISSVVAGESDSKEPKNKETAANYMTTAIIAVVGASVVLIGGFTLFVRKKK